VENPQARTMKREWTRREWLEPGGAGADNRQHRALIGAVGAEGCSVLSFLLERRHFVLLSRFEGILTSDDLMRQDRLVCAFSAREGPARSIVDFTDVVTVEIDTGTITALAQRRVRRPRLFVVPQPEMFGLARLYSAHTGLAGQVEPSLVRTRAEAYAALGLDDPAFEPIALD